MEKSKKYSSGSSTPVKKLREKCDSLQEALLCACKSIAEKDTNSAASEDISKKFDSGNIPNCPPCSRVNSAANHTQESCSCETPKSQKSSKIIVCMYKNNSKSNNRNERCLNFETFHHSDKIPPDSSKNTSIHPEAKLEGKEDNLQNLTKINRHLKYQNKTLTDELADLQLELKHLIERIEGPMRRQLCKQQNLSVDLEHQLTLASSKKSTSYKKEIEFLKQQLSFTNNNINDLTNINQRLKDEIRILNFKCDQLQNLLVTHKINEANNINNLN